MESRSGGVALSDINRQQHDYPNPLSHLCLVLLRRTE